MMITPVTKGKVMASSGLTLKVNGLNDAHVEEIYKFIDDSVALQPFNGIIIHFSGKVSAQSFLALQAGLERKYPQFIERILLTHVDLPIGELSRSQLLQLRWIIEGILEPQVPELLEESE
jgi:hypothetical protein